MQNKNHIGISGKALIEVIDHNGRVVSSRSQPNLLLDQGMDRIAVDQIANLFLACARGTGQSLASEDLNGTYWQYQDTVTRDTGTRDFVSGDIGKLIKLDGVLENRITARISNSVVRVFTMGTAGGAGSGLAAFLYSVQQIGLGAETHRTTTYSAGSGDNSTVDAANVRTLKRTFIFNPETGSGINVADLYNKTGDQVVRASGSARNFTANDVGFRIFFVSTGTEYEITEFEDADTVTVTDTDNASITGSTITLYGFNNYNEIGFSHSGTPGNNLNIRIKLASAVAIQVPTAIYPGQQLRVTYIMAVTVTPSSSNSGTSSIYDPNNLISQGQGGYKPGSYSIESLALSYINQDGTTNASNNALEPSVPGFLGLSTSFAALVSFNGPDIHPGPRLFLWSCLTILP